MLESEGVAMVWLKGIAGVVCTLIGLVWIGQGTNLLPGSFMTGQLQWAVIGLVVLVAGVWLLWSVISNRRSARTTL